MLFEFCSCIDCNSDRSANTFCLPDSPLKSYILEMKKKQSNDSDEIELKSTAFKIVRNSSGTYLNMKS